MIEILIRYAPLGSFVGNVIWLLVALATYYQASKSREEARAARDGTLHSQNCLEFIAGDGSCINLVPLETLHSLPREGDVILLPGDGITTARDTFVTGAFLVESVEHIYTHVVRKGARPREARLTKAVAKVTSLNPALES